MSLHYYVYHQDLVWLIWRGLGPVRCSAGSPIAFGGSEVFLGF